MGKPLCDSAPTLAAEPPTQLPLPLDTLIPINPPSHVASTAADSDPEYDNAWGNVSGLEHQQKENLEKLHSKGILWKHPEDTKTSNSRSVLLRLRHGGEVSSDGNCLFTSMEKAMLGLKIDGKELRRRTVRRFLEDFENANLTEREAIDVAIRHMYFPDLKCGWGIHVVQEIKLIVKKSERNALDSAILELVQIGMQREFAAESIYKERCVRVEDGDSWAKYMSVSGSADDEYDIVTLQYTEDGLLSIDENRNGNAAAFGDDIAIECLATEFKREIYVVQAHGSDAMVDEENCVFFLPHRPRSEICELPIFLFMKGTGWCGAGGDHYEPLIAHSQVPSSSEKPAFIL